MKVLYEEKQSLPKLLLPAILAPTAIIWLVGLMQRMSDEPLGNHPMSDSGMTIFLIGFGVVLPLLILSVRGRIVVDKESLTLSLLPFFKKKVRLGDILAIEEMPAGPPNELQSWGVQYRHGTWRFVLQGNHGLKLHLADGKKIFLTCADREELLRALEVSKR